MMSTLTLDAGPQMKALIRRSLIVGWASGYATALADVVTIHDAARAVKH